MNPAPPQPVMPDYAHYLVTLRGDGEDKTETITAQVFQVLADGSIGFGNLLDGGTRIDITQVYSSHEWKYMKKSTISPGGRA